MKLKCKLLPSLSLLTCIFVLKINAASAETEVSINTPLYAPNAPITKEEPASGNKEIPTDSLKLWFRADSGVTHSDNKVSQWDDKSGSGLHAKLYTGQPTFLNSAIGNKPAVYFNGKGDVLEFKGWSPNGLTAMTIIIVSANTKYQPEPGPGKGAEGGTHSTLQSILNWPQSSPDAKWGVVLLSAYQKSVSFRFGTGQNDNINNWKRPVSIGDSPTMTTAIHDGATEKVFVEGKLVETKTGKLTTIKNCATYGYLGRWSHGGDASGWFLGTVAEVIVYARALGDSEREKVENYLAAKYFGKVPVSQFFQGVPHYNKHIGYQKVLIGRFSSDIAEGNLFDIRGRRVNNQTPSSGILLLLNRK